MTGRVRVLTRLAVHPLRSSAAAAAAAVLFVAACDDRPAPHDTTPPPEFAQAFVDAHNALRAAATPTPSPPLAPLTWSEDAAAVAQAWAVRCTFEHDPNRGARGENLAATAPSGAVTPTEVVLGDPSTELEGWATEAADYDYATNTCADGEVCGHYTQVVWRDTLRVGCARAVCYGQAPFAWSGAWDLWVCDYEPAGNVVGERPY